MDRNSINSNNNNNNNNNEASLWTKSFIIISLINMLIFFGFQMAMAGMPLYVFSLGANDFIVGIVTTIGAAAALMIRPFSGIIVDRFSRRNVLVAGLIVMVLSTLGYAAFPFIGTILLLRVLHGVGWGLSSTAISTLAADVIPKSRFAEGMGYFGLVTSLAMVIAPALAVMLILKSLAVELFVVAAGSVVIGLVFSVFQLPKGAQTAGTQIMDAQTTGEQTMDAQPTIEIPDTKGLSIRKKVADFIEKFFEKKAYLPAVTILLICLAFAPIATFIAIHGLEQGVEDIPVYFIVYAVVIMITRPPIGKIIDKVGFFIPGILSMLSVAVSMIMIAFADNLFMFCLAGVFAGLGVGTAMSTMQTMAVTAVPPRRRGVATSTYLFGIDAGMGLGALVAGFIAIRFGYSIMYILMAAFPIIGCIIFLFVGKKRISSYSYKADRTE